MELPTIRQMERRLPWLALTLPIALVRFSRNSRNSTQQENIKENLMSLMQENKNTWQGIETVAWVRTGALGDLLVGLASLVEAQKSFPNAKFSVVGPKLWCEILSPEVFPYVERILVVERKGVIARIFTPDGEGWETSNAEFPLHEVLKGTQAVVNTNIDSYRYGFSALRARIPTRIGSAPASMAWLYTHTSPFFGKDPLVHERDAALMILEYADSGASKFFRTTDRNRVNLAEWVGRSQLIHKWRALGLPPGKNPNLDRARELTNREPGTYILVNPTSSRREKAWPSDHFYDVMLKSEVAFSAAGLEILVIGSRSETEWLKEVARGRFRVIQPPTIRDLQDVLSGSRGLLTNTSSVQFIAAMTGTPAITLMGRARPEIWGPLGPNDQVVLGRPPAELNDDIFQQELEGYRSIEVDEVHKRFIKLPDQERLRSTSSPAH